MPKLTVLQGNIKTEIKFNATPLLSAVLREHGFAVETPCGGKGICSRCRVEAAGALSPETEQESEFGSRLACRTRLLGDACVTLSAPMAMENIAASGVLPPFPLRPMEGCWGLAVDIGTTTLAAAVLSLASGEVLAAAAAENPQRSIAADVVGRMEAAMNGQAGRLQSLVRDAVLRLQNGLCAKLSLPPEAINQAVVTGNTTMLYLLTGQNSEPLSHAPFRADCLFGQWQETPWKRTYLPRCVGAFVGADITCAVLASRMCRREETALLMDVGTNGEIALWHRGKLYVCATAAGPAFEGGGIECGCGSVAGAIDRVWAENGALACATIGNRAPVGICGSGVIDTAASLLELGLMDETGALVRERVPLRGAVALTQRDVRNFQVAKSAVAAGVLTLCSYAGVPAGEVSALYLAGGFGKHIDLRNAAAVGLIPQALVKKTRVIGNAALAGAEMLLLQTDFLEETNACAQESEIVVLSGNPIFSENFMQCMTLAPI